MPKAEGKALLVGEETVESFIHWADKALNNDFRKIVMAMANLWHKHYDHGISVSELGRLRKKKAR